MNKQETEDSQRLHKICLEANEALRYGNLWLDFSVNEHISYARYKTKRAALMLNRGDVEPARDDLIDAINSVRFAIDCMDKEAK